MPTFGIYSPILGFNDAVPHVFLSKSFTPDCSNVGLWEGEVRTVKMRVVELTDTSGITVPVPDENAILKYFHILGDSGEKYLLSFTAEHIYCWKTATREWDQLWEYSSGQSCTSWSVAALNGKVIATNNAGYPVKWYAGVDDDFEDYRPEVASGVTIDRAKCVVAFENHIIFGNYSTSDGNSYFNGIIWSDLDDEDMFLQDGLTDAGGAPVQGQGYIQGFGIKGSELYVFKDRSIRAYWYTETSFVFFSKSVSEFYGCIGTGSIVNDAYGNLYFYASDLTFREIDSGIISVPIEESARKINQNALELITSGYITEYGEVWWSVPSDGESAVNDITCVYKNGIWMIRRSGVSALGFWERTGSLDWASLPYNSWDEWAWDSWLAPEASIGFPVDICSDASGITYQSHGAYKDNGSNYTSYFVLTTDFGDGTALRQYKRLLNILVYIYSMGSGTLSIYVKRDSEAEWQYAGYINMDYTSQIAIPELPVDYRAKSFLIKIESTVPFRFLGMEFDYLYAGLR